LREHFGHLALFFHNALQGRVIGVVWKPSTFRPKGFKIVHAQHSVPLKLLPMDSPVTKKLNIQADPSIKGPQLVTNIFEVLDEFAVLGTGLVREITLGN